MIAIGGSLGFVLDERLADIDVPFCEQRFEARISFLRIQKWKQHHHATTLAEKSIQALEFIACEFVRRSRDNEQRTILGNFARMKFLEVSRFNVGVDEDGGEIFVAG